MQADTRGKTVACLPLAVGIALAVLAGGCSMNMPGAPMSRSPTKERSPARQVPSAPVVGLKSKAIDEGVALVGERKYVEAEMQFRRAEVWHRAEGDKGRTAECLFWIGFCHEKQGRTAEAREQYKSVIRKYPKTAAAGQATSRLGRLPAPKQPKPSMAFCVLSAAAVGEDKDDKLKVHLRLIDPPAVLHVGDKIKAGMVLENISGSDVLLPDSDRNSVRFCAQWYSYLRYETFPGKIGDLHFGPVGADMPPSGQGREVYRPLAPKAKTPEVVDSHVLLLPGKALLPVMFTSRRGIHLLHLGPDGKWNGPRWWSGTVLAEMPLVISEEIPPAMKQQYDDVRALLAAPDKPNAEKLKALAEVAGQKHLFAARLVREIWQGKASPAIKAAALEHMATLLELGTAYEALGDLLDVLADESAPAAIRRRILVVMPDLRLTHTNPGLRVENQGYYELSAALRDKAAQAISSVAKGRDPFLAVEARKVLKWPRWGPLRPIPPVIDRATTMPSTAVP